MKSKFLAAAASIAFIAAGVAAEAQETQKHDQHPAAQGAEPKAGAQEPGAAKAAQAEPRRDEMKGGNARAEGERNEMKGAERSRAAETPGQERKAAQGQNEQRQGAEGKRVAEPTGEKSNGARTGANEQQRNERDRNGARTAEHNEGRGQARVQGNVKMSSEHATRVGESLRREGRREHVDADIRVGARLPESVVVRPLPQDVIAIVPEYRGYDYFIDDNDEIVFVSPQTHEVVGMIDYEGRAAADDNYTNVRASRPCPTEN